MTDNGANQLIVGLTVGDAPVCAADGYISVFRYLGNGPGSMNLTPTSSTKAPVSCGATD